MPITETTNTHGGQAPRARPEARRPYLMVIAGAEVGTLHKLTHERTVVGRGTAAQLRLEDGGVSREHAELVVDGGHLAVRDLGSTNGTFVNGVRANGHELHDGDKVSIGGATLLVFTDQDGIELAYQQKRDRSAGRDPTTAALKPEVFAERLGQEISFSRRHGAPLALLLWEIDAFAAAEDRHGPAATRVLLASVVQAANVALRDDDIVAIIGPGRFAVAIRETSASEGHARAELLRAAIAVAAFELGVGAAPEKLTTSVGVAVCAASAERSTQAAAELLQSAADALARALAGGGNRVESAPAPPDSP